MGHPVTNLFTLKAGRTMRQGCPFFNEKNELR